MLDTLPPEVLDVIVQYSTKYTLSCLSTVSHGTYFISVRTLYASIPEMDMVCMTQCLRTLSKKCKLARLVQSFSFQVPSYSYPLRAILALFSHALSNMNNLRVLLLKVNVPISLNFANRMSCQLEKLSCVILPGGSYPIQQLLSSQPTIKALHIVCRPDDVSALNWEALPVLKSLSAPNRLLPILLPSRLSRLSRLCVINVMTSPRELLALSTSLAQLDPPESLELCLRVNFLRATPNALEYLGQAARFITSLRLDKFGAPIGQEELQTTFVPTRSNFPKLKTLTIMPHLPTPPAFIRDLQTQPVDTLEVPNIQPLTQDLPSFMQDMVDFLADTVVGVYNLNPDNEPLQTQSQSTTLDALHDSSCHADIIKAWHQAHPGLERVVFPAGVYVLK
ncbi:unnamed protein product [Rhizoctonia solani]|uniref:F-box domain-containing protein n=1 Tax=Rhizoctonia solani TaxID=456999 RepID=A0A8H2XGT9_9AGAM|nr:unnamed protein product [Rhizoctonia solani]